MALPAAFEQRMQRLLGEEYPAFRDALARPQARGLRVSPLKIAPEQFAAQAPFTLTPVPWAPGRDFSTPIHSGRDGIRIMKQAYITFKNRPQWQLVRSRMPSRENACWICVAAPAAKPPIWRGACTARACSWPMKFTPAARQFWRRASSAWACKTASCAMRRRKDWHRDFRNFLTALLSMRRAPVRACSGKTTIRRRANGRRSFRHFVLRGRRKF